MTTTLDHAACQAALTALGRGGDAAEFHGCLSGALCVLPADQIDLLRLLDAGVPAGARAPDLLKSLRDATHTALQDEDLGFTPLLPADEFPLSVRVEALAAWCAGFLFGLSTKPGFQLDQLSADAREVVDDFAEFTRAGHEEDADGELEETAYAELVEYLRVGAQLVYMDLRPQPIPDPSDSQRMH